jgi:hypothetical protein
MKQNTKSTKHASHPVVCADCTENAIVEQEVKLTAADFKTAVLIVSLAVNLFVLTAWLVVETTSDYNAIILGYLQR